MKQCDVLGLPRLGPRQVALAALLLANPLAWAAPGGAIFTCTDANGKKLTSDRLIPACTTREQRVLNPDGSLHHVVPPTLTADERVEKEASERDAAAAFAAKQDAVRRDRNLLARFPNEAAHRKARIAALDNMRSALKSSEDRLELLAKARKPLMDEAEFYNAKTMPATLRVHIEGNDAATEAQRSLIQNQRSEILRINKRYDAEFEYLKKLWGGAPAGSLGPLPLGDASAEAASAAASK